MARKALVFRASFLASSASMRSMITAATSIIDVNPLQRAQLHYLCRVASPLWNDSITSSFSNMANRNVTAVWLLSPAASIDAPASRSASTARAHTSVRLYLQIVHTSVSSPRTRCLCHAYTEGSAGRLSATHSTVPRCHMVPVSGGSVLTWWGSGTVGSQRRAGGTAIPRSTRK